jgi:pimeloyl-ACP methyl ester carboxylesterase
MSTQDALGHDISGANGAALDHYEQASHELRCLIANPLATAQRAIAASPAFTMAHLLAAYLNLLGTEPGGFAPARAALAAAQALPMNEREAMHAQAVEHLVNQRWHAAGLTLEDLSIRFPRDVLALQAGHQIDFFTGHSRLLRDRIARSAHAWRPGMPGYHAVLGMHAFGLEETGDYARAESLGRRAVELEPRDGWAWHAVAHVMEMQDRRRDGVAWLGNSRQVWSEGSFLQVHNWWHLALFHLGLDQIDEVMQLVDERVLGGASPVVLDMIDASAMLWRLALRGIDVGERWQALAERWLAVSERSTYAFNDLHAMIAFVGAGRDADAQRLLAAQDAALAEPGDNAQFLLEVGRDATQAIHAFGAGRFERAVQLLRPLRSHAHRFGGSHAQRDLIDLTLIEAAERAGQRGLAGALRHERRERGIGVAAAAADKPAPASSMAGLRVQRQRLRSGLELEVAQRGDASGLPVVMLHGITDSWRSFEGVLPHLPRQWQVVLPSQRGHGASDKPDGGYRSRDFAADVAELIEHLQLPPVVLVGHSMGAAVAMQLAAERPELVRALVSVGGFASFSDKAELAAFIDSTIGPLTDPIPRALADEFQRSTLAHAVDESFLQSMIEQSLRVPAAVWRAAFAGLLDDAFVAGLGRIAAPTLLLHGGADAYVPGADLQTLARAIAQAQPVVWPDAGHAMHWEAPQRFAQTLIEFVQGLPQARAAKPRSPMTLVGSQTPRAA